MSTSGDLEIRLHVQLSTMETQDRRRRPDLSRRGCLVSTVPTRWASTPRPSSAGRSTRPLASGPDVQLLVNHEGLPISRTTNGSLRLFATDTGLEFTATASASDPDAAAVAAKVKAGLMDQCSFAFRVVDQNWNDDRTQRDITEVSMDRGDVSIVNYGANPNTSVIARARLNERRPPHSLYVARARALALRGGRPTPPPRGTKDWMLWARNEAGRR